MICRSVKPFAETTSLNLRRPESQSAGLVQQDGVHGGQRFQVKASFNNRSLMCGPTDRPRMARGVPAAMPHAPATMTTEMVDLTCG